jgi:hypothetical protein
MGRTLFDAALPLNLAATLAYSFNLAGQPARAEHVLVYALFGRAYYLRNVSGLTISL